MQAEIGNGVLGAENGRADIGDSLDDHARDVQVRGLGAGASEERVHVDLVEPRDVSKGDGAAEERERGAASWCSQRAVFVVWGAVVPGAQAGARGSGEGTRWVVLVHEG